MPETTPYAASPPLAAPGRDDPRVASVPAVDRGPLLRVESLSVRVLGSRPYDILCPTDLTLDNGEVLGLVGESGSGKTTLAMALLGYARPGTRLSGSVRIGGEEIIAGTGPPAGGHADGWFPTFRRTRPPR